MAVNGSRLALLMEKLELSGKELARVLNVHSSLVSKWRNGSRPLHFRSPYLSRLAEYCLAVDSARKYDTVRELLAVDYPEADLQSKETLAGLLARWLCASPAEYGGVGRVKVPAKHRIYRTHFEVYKGAEGRREVLLHLLDMLISLAKGQEFYVFTDEDESWLFDDAEFVRLWRDKSLEALRRGASLRIVHALHRDPRAIVQSLARWFPLHATGQTSAYFYPKHTGRPFRMTLVIVKDRCALAGTSVDGLTRQVYTRLYYDPVSVQQMQEVFMSVLFESRPLLEKVDSRFFAEPLNYLVRVGQQAGDNYFYNTVPFFSTMSRELFLRVLQDSGLKESHVRMLLPYYDKLNYQFRLDIARHRQRYLLDLHLMEQSLLSPTPVGHGLSPVTGLRINTSASHSYEQIKHLLGVMEECPNVEVALIHEPPLPSLNRLSLWVRDSGFVAFSPPEAPEMFTTHEPTVVNSFWQFMDEFWQSIPQIQREKEWVRKKLLGLPWASAARVDPERTVGGAIGGT